MSKYIDADALLKSEIKRCRCIPIIGSCYNDEKRFDFVLQEQPTADVVEVVRCKDCKYYVANYCTRDIKGRTNMFYMDSNDFCSYGKKVE